MALRSGMPLFLFERGTVCHQHSCTRSRTPSENSSTSQSDHSDPRPRRPMAQPTCLLTVKAMEMATNGNLMKDSKGSVSAVLPKAGGGVRIKGGLGKHCSNLCYLAFSEGNDGPKTSCFQVLKPLWGFKLGTPYVCEFIMWAEPLTCGQSSRSHQ